MTTTKPDERLIPVGDDFTEPHMEPIHTAPADLDDAKRSTEAGMGFVLALVAIAVVALSATVIALWPVPEQVPARAVAGVAR